MKKLLLSAGYKLFALTVLFVTLQFSALAEGGPTNEANSLSAVQVVGWVALLIALIIIPAFKSSRRLAAK